VATGVTTRAQLALHGAATAACWWAR
jgi:hypothetical protein